MMEQTDKALAELLKLLEQKSPVAMEWLLDVGYRQAYITGWMFAVGAIAAAIVFVVGCNWAWRKWGDSSVGDGECIVCGLSIVFGAFGIAAFAPIAIIRLCNPGFYVYQMFRGFLQ